MLEESGIISKMYHPENKAKVLHQLTQKGIDLLPVLLEIQLWADKYYTINPDIKILLKEIKNDKDSYIKW